MKNYKEYLLCVLRAYPLGFIVLSAYFGYVTLWILIGRIYTLTTIYWGCFFFFVFWFSIVVDSLMCKIRKDNTLTGIGLGALIVLVGSLIVYYLVFQNGFFSLTSAYSNIKYVYYYASLNAVVLGVVAYVVLQDIDRFMSFIKAVCVNVLLWCLGAGLMGLFAIGVQELVESFISMDYLWIWLFFTLFVLCLYTYGLCVRLLGFLATIQNRSSHKPLNAIVLWVFNIFAFGYILLLGLYALSPQQYFNGVVHIVLWIGIFLVLLAWANAVSHKPKISFMFLVIACILESIAIWAISVRINTYGFTPNRIFVLLTGVFFAFVVISYMILKFHLIASTSIKKDFMRIVAVGFVVCFGLGGFATPSISIYSQLHHLQSLEHILNDPNTQRTKTKGEIIKLVSAYNSALLLLQEFGQCSDKHTLQSSDYLTQTPLLESQN